MAEGDPFLPGPIEPIAQFSVKAAEERERGDETMNRESRAHTAASERRTVNPEWIRFAIPFVLIIVAVPAAQSQSLTNPTKMYKGTITLEESGDVPGDGIVKVYEDPYPDAVTSSKVNNETGEYSVILDPATLYRFEVAGLGCYTRDFWLGSPIGGNYEERTVNFTIRKVAIDSILYHGRPFAEGSAQLTDRGDLDRILFFLAENPTVEVAIEVALVKDEVDPVTADRVTAIKEAFRNADVSTTRINWVRKVGDPFNEFTFRISGFEMPNG
jgi:hypothetical protein